MVSALHRTFLILLLLVTLVLTYTVLSSGVRAAPSGSNTLYLPTVLQQIAPTPAPAPTPTATATPTNDFAEQVVELVNEERAQAGCAPLAMHPALNSAAWKHSEDMALNDFFSHTGSNGSSPWERMSEAGYQWSNAAENIAAGYPSPESVVAAWMNSSGHRGNILNCDLEDMGVGYYFLENDSGNVNYYRYWTQVFGTQ